MIVTADDFEMFKVRYKDDQMQNRLEEAVKLFDQLVKSIEPRLVITE